MLGPHSFWKLSGSVGLNTSDFPTPFDLTLMARSEVQLLRSTATAIRSFWMWYPAKHIGSWRHVNRPLGELKKSWPKFFLDDPELSMSEAFFEATRTFNSRELIRRYSPIQHALGRSPDFHDRLFPHDLPNSPDVLVENADGEMSRNLKRMKVAQEAFLDWTNSQRLTRAANSRSRNLQSYRTRGSCLYLASTSEWTT